jgi:hypothetical protein
VALQDTIDKYLDTVIANMPSAAPENGVTYTPAEWPFGANWCDTIEQMFSDMTDPLITPAGYALGRLVAEPALNSMLTPASPPPPFATVFSGAVTAYAALCTGTPAIPPAPGPFYSVGATAGTATPPAAPLGPLVEAYILAQVGPTNEAFITGLYGVIQTWAKTGTLTNAVPTTITWVWP